MLACRPVEWPTEGLLAEREPTIIYPGAAVMACMNCGTGVYVGPKQQGFLEQIPDLPIICFSCIPQFTDVDTPVVHLGNDHLPHEGGGS